MSAGVVLLTLLLAASPSSAAPENAAPENTAPDSAAKDDACARPCDQDLACWVAEQNCWLEAGQTRQAVQRIKAAVRSANAPAELRLLLARAYLADDNPFWAQRTLQRLSDDLHQRCQALAWLAHNHLALGHLDLAAETLDSEGCPDRPALDGRWALLRAELHTAQDQTGEASVQLQRVRQAEALFPEDRQRWQRLRALLDPGWLEPVQIRLDLGGGLSSNALAGSPTDPGREGTPSPLLRVEPALELVAPAAGFWRPGLAAGLRLQAMSAAEASALSYAETWWRPQLHLGRGTWRGRVGYRGDLLLLARRDRRLFAEGHRLEGELDTPGHGVLFVGGGRRQFAEGGRSRWEFDLGGGAPVPVGSCCDLLLAGALRAHDAVGEAYDLLGASALARLGLYPGAGLRVQLGATLMLDSYPNSGGERGLVAFGSLEPRHDLLSKLSAALWSPSWVGLSGGLSYDLAWRVSSADARDRYSYLEHRVLLLLRWRWQRDPWAPPTLEPASHVPLGATPGQEPGTDRERIQDLLRQDEAARRGSSCVD